MTKLVLAFFVGVIAGSIGVQLQAQRVEERTRETLAAHEMRTAANGNAKARDAASNPRTASTEEQTEPLRSGLAVTADQPQRDQPIAAVTDEPEIPVTQSHEPLLRSSHDGRTLGEWHEKLEREAEDMGWSYEKEQRLSEFFAPPHGIAFDVRSIECRKTMCEIQAFALGPMQQNTVTQDLQAEPWYDFSSSFMRLGEHENGTSVLMYLMRES